MRIKLPDGNYAVFPDDMTTSAIEAVLQKQFPVKSEVSQLESGLRGAAQGVTFGLQDEIVGAVKAADKALWNTSTKNLKADYVAARDEQRAANLKAEEANPKTYIAGELAAGLAVPGGALKGAATLTRVAKTGAVVGGVTAAGKSAADLTEGEISQAAKDVALGTLVGTAGGVAAKKLLDGAGEVGARMMKRYQKAADAGFKETGGYMPVTKIAANSLEEAAGSGLFPKEGKAVFDAGKTLFTKGPKKLIADLDEKKIVDIIKNISPGDIARYAALGVSSKGMAVLAGGLAANSLRKSLNKFGPQKLHQMGTMIQQLKTNAGYSEKWADVSRPLVESLGIVGAGLAHVKLLETQPKYRAFVKKSLKENKINKTLLFNQKKAEGNSNPR